MVRPAAGEAWYCWPGARDGAVGGSGPSNSSPAPIPHILIMRPCSLSTPALGMGADENNVSRGGCQNVRRAVQVGVDTR